VRFLSWIGAAAALAVTGIVPGAAPAAPGTLFALKTSPGSRALVRVDARTLEPVGAPLAMEPTSGPFVRSPDGSTLAVGAGRALTFIDTTRMTQVRVKQVVANGQLRIVGWPTKTRLFAFTCCSAKNELIVFDPVKRVVVKHVPVKRTFGNPVALSNGIAYVASPVNSISPARVVVVDRGGAIRAVTVQRIRAGVNWKRQRSGPIGNIRQPGFTADAERGVGYLVDAAGLVAEVDLETLKVTYHRLTTAARRLARVEKELNGPMRFAQWLGEGRIAVTGSDAKTRRLSNGTRRATWSPAGVAVVDTRSWRIRMLEPASTGFDAEGDAIVLWKSNTVEAFATNGAPLFSLPIEDGPAYAQVFGRTAYVWGDKRVTIVDLDSGTVIGAIPRPALYLLPAN
jgi:hypothetical protein